MKLSRKLIQSVFWCAFSSALFVGFQNCNRAEFSRSQEDVGKLLSAGNGGPYGGKPGVFRNFVAQEPCRETDRNGKPLPNNVVLIRPNDQGVLTPYLARNSCLDIAPVEIPADQVHIDSAYHTIVYQSRSYSDQDRPGDFDLVAASCPVGKSPIPDAVRQNRFASALDWAFLQNNSSGVWTPGWYNFPGVNVGLYSTLSSLPAFRILRNDPTLLDEWRRASQHVYLNANTEYSFTFLAQPGSSSAADFTFYRGWTGIAGDPRNEEAVLTFDFSTQTVQTVRVSNVSGLRATITPVGQGFLCTVYWVTSATGDQGESNIGVSPSARGQASGQVGDSIIATAAQLVPVNEFCQ